MFFKNHGILGINARNLLYIRPYNAKKAIKLADDKIKTKQFLSARGVPVPKLYGIIRDYRELEKFDFNVLPQQFVVKPNHGYGGEGIIPVLGKKEALYALTGGKKMSKEEMKDHITDILDGRFSISNITDSAFFEQLIISDERIGRYSYAGLPDIRIVVHNLIPVMAMLRLPTQESNGKANLHLGAVGIGIDIAKGEATHIAYKNRIIEELPNQLGKIRGLKIPFWDEILTIASKVQLITNLGYLAVDICIDKNTGPVLLEINARAGLGVQIANLAPLRKRLQRIEGLKVNNPTKGVRIAKDMFGNVVEKEITQLSGKIVISTDEDVEVIRKIGNLRLSAKMSTTSERSVIDQEVAQKAGLLDDLDNYDDEKSTLKLKFTLKNRRISTIVDVEKISSEKYKMMIGKRDLTDFLIDAGIRRASPKETPADKKPAPEVSKSKMNFAQIDEDLINIDNKIKLLYHIRPLNLEKEEVKFYQNPSYNPEFQYPKLKFDPLELVDRLNKITTDESPLGIIYARKKSEISDKIALLESIDEEAFGEISVKLFGRPTAEEIKHCKDMILANKNRNEAHASETYDVKAAKVEFEKIFMKYGLKKWKVKIKDNLVSACVAGKNNCLFIKDGSAFTKERLESLIVHEIETHIITAENGKLQPYEIFNRGLADYLVTQEGLAMYNVETQCGMSFESNFKAHSHVLAIDIGLRGGSFSDIYHQLFALGIASQNAFRSAVKAKRGYMDTKKTGAFSKDYIYYKGYFEIKKFINNGGDLKDLYIGKINSNDLETVKKIPGIQSPSILPEWLK